MENEVILHRGKSAIGKELDIYVPAMRAAIEPGSWALHKPRPQKDIRKAKLCKEAGIRLITVYDKFPDENKPPFASDCVTYSGDFNKDDHVHLWSVVNNLLEALSLQHEYSPNEIASIESGAYKHSKSLTHEGFIARTSGVNPTIKILGQHVNSNQRIECECTVCGREWTAVPSALLAGDRCWDCARKAIGKSQRMSLDEFAKKAESRQSGN